MKNRRKELLEKVLKLIEHYVTGRGINKTQATL